MGFVSSPRGNSVFSMDRPDRRLANKLGNHSREDESPYGHVNRCLVIAYGPFDMAFRAEQIHVEMSIILAIPGAA